MHVIDHVQVVAAHRQFHPVPVDGARLRRHRGVWRRVLGLRHQRTGCHALQSHQAQAPVAAKDGFQHGRNAFRRHQPGLHAAQPGVEHGRLTPDRGQPRLGLQIRVALVGQHGGRDFGIDAAHIVLLLAEFRAQRSLPGEQRGEQGRIDQEYDQGGRGGKQHDPLAHALGVDLLAHLEYACFHLPASAAGAVSGTACRLKSMKGANSTLVLPSVARVARVICSAPKPLPRIALSRVRRPM